jgi:poly(hydroxyalkanoate) depolymerase family esterase
MNDLLKIDMAEVTRLTRAGRLTEAMALLRLAPEGAEFRGPAAAFGAPPMINRSSIAARRPAATFAGARAAHGFARGGEQRRPPNPNELSGLIRARRQTPSEGARFEERSFSNEAGARTYKLYVPSSYGERPVPLLVMLHGCGQSPDDFAAGTRMNEIAEEEGFLVAYPAQSRAANASRCWNWFSFEDQQRDRGEPSLLAGVTRQVIHDFSIDPARVYVAGLSAGGAAAAIMGTTYPDVYAAVGVHSGLACGAAADVPSAFVAMQQGGAPRKRGGRKLDRVAAIPTIVFHGDADHTVHSVNADQVIAEARGAARLQKTTTYGEAASGMAFTRIVETEGDGRAIFEQWILHGAGHAWSGGSAAGSYTDPRGPDATREMVRFFRQCSH